MAKKIVDATVNEIQALLAQNKLTIGTEVTLKELKRGKLAKVYVTKNAPEMVKDDLSHYTGIGSVELIELEQNNEELGIVTRKPYHVSVIGVTKDE